MDWVGHRKNFQLQERQACLIYFKNINFNLASVILLDFKIEESFREDKILSFLEFVCTSFTVHFTPFSLGAKHRGFGNIQKFTDRRDITKVIFATLERWKTLKLHQVIFEVCIILNPTLFILSI